MQRIVIIANGAAYGSESLFNSLRRHCPARAAVRPRSQAVSDVRRRHRRAAGQKPAEGYNVQQMLEILTAQQVPVKLCKTCADGRGVSALPLVDGVEVGTLVELAQWTTAADKVLTF